MKQRGGMLAKGRLLGIQFHEMFKDGLYLKLAEHANGMAKLLREGIKEKGYDFLVHSPTNQIFPILPTFWSASLKRIFSSIAGAPLIRKEL